MKQYFLTGFCLFLFLFTGYTTSMAQTGDYFSNEQGVALGGYDVVGYFKAHEAERGSKAFSVSIKGSTFYFANAENKAAFEKNPSAYLPAFGGYCAFAMASGNGQVPSNSETFKVYNGKLYLFYNDYYEGTPFNTIVPWNADEAKNLAQAEQNWQKLN